MFIPTAKNTSTVTDMRVDAIGLLKDVEKQGMKYIFQKSKPVVALVSMELFAKFVEAQEHCEKRELINSLKNK